MGSKKLGSMDAREFGIAIVGAGERGVYVIGAQLAALYREAWLRVVGVYDLLPRRAQLGAEYLTKVYAEGGTDCQVGVYESLDKVMADPAVQLVIVTTHTSQHLEPTVRALEAGKKVYLDKPISVTLSDALAIHAAEKKYKSPIIMGFTRRYETPWVELAKLLNAGTIGTLQMVLLRSVIPYSRYLQRWHRQQDLSGGALNDKCSHHFDVLNWFTGSACDWITAMGGRSDVFAPEPDGPKRCRECDRDCPYRARSGLIDQEEGLPQSLNDSWVEAEATIDRDDNCVYLPGSDILDHALVSLHYQNGVKASLFFTIFGPWAPDQETLELVGSSGRMRLERSTGSIDVIADHGRKRETITFNDPARASSHYGADRHLVRKLRAFCQGSKPTVGVDEGIASLKLVLAAQQSIRDNGASVSPNGVRDNPRGDS